MPLANLNINISANASNFLNGMSQVETRAREGMGKAAGSVSNARASIERDSDAAARGLQKIGTAAGSIDIAGEMTADMAKAKEEVKRFGEEVKNHAERTAIFMGAALVTGISATIFAGAYAAYKSIGFLSGLVTGESYKSANIDALIAADRQTRELQESLSLAAVDANALTDSLRRLGVSTSDYVAVAGKATEAAHSEGQQDRLEKLGVAYKDINGKISDNYTIVQNAKKKLDEYTEGWDRNQAAAYLGLGTYQQINSFLKVNQQEIANSRERLNDYNLGIGTESQNAVDRYQTAMLAFRNETKLTSDGFKRAVADNIMPMLTDLANYLKDGWPVSVRVFRYTIAQLSSMMYGFKEVIELSIDALKGIGRTALAVVTGDWSNIKTELGKTWQEIVADSKKNADAMALAWAFDDRTQAPAQTKGKSWVQPAGDTSKFDAALERLKRQLVETSPDLSTFQKQIKAIDYEVMALSDQMPEYTDTWKKYGQELKANLSRTNEIRWASALMKVEIGELEESLKDAGEYGFGTFSKGLDMSLLKMKGLKEFYTLGVPGPLGPMASKKSPYSLTGPSETGWAQGPVVFDSGAYEQYVGMFGSDKDKSFQLAANRVDQLNKFHEMGIIAEKEYLQRVETEYMAHDQRMLAMETSFNQQKISLGLGVAEQSAGLMKQAAGENKGLQLAALAFEKGLAIARIMIQTEVAAAGIWAGLAALGPVAPAAIAAETAMLRTMSYASIALVAASGVAEAGNISGRRAMGGPVTAGKTYWVGERGEPELFTPSQSGYITPASKFSGGGVVQHITIDARGADAGVEQRIDAAMRRAKDEAKAEIYSSMNRGGAFSVASGRRR